MSNIKFILFDCMETLIDLTQLPSFRDYALWAFNGSGVEHYWNSFEDFFQQYKIARESIGERLPEHRDYEMVERFKFIVHTNLKGFNKSEMNYIIKKLYDTYWETYKSKCYIKDDVKDVLEYLSGRFGLGVVSNFMIGGGIEELLRSNGIFHYFDFVITSINERWRKPYPEIYNAAILQTGVLPCEIAFIGDDYVNDYVTPADIGMRTILLDRYNKYPEVKERISDFYDLKDRFLSFWE